MKKVIVGIVGVVVIALGATWFMQANSKRALEAFVDGRSTRDVVSALEDTPVGGDIFAKAFPDRIELQDGSNVLNLEDDEFYVSIAPFINETHPCTFHVFPGCQAELVNQEFQVRMTDGEGNVYFDGMKQTYGNGFMGFWLPRDKEYTIEIEADGYFGKFQFSTFADDPTCLTEFRLVGGDRLD